MSLDQTGFKFKGDCLVDSVSAEQNTLGCRDTTCLVPLWELSRLMTSGAMLPVRLWPRDVPPLVQTGQQCQLKTDLSPPQPCSNFNIDRTLDEDSKYHGLFISRKAADHAQKKVCSVPDHSTCSLSSFSAFAWLTTHMNEIVLFWCSLWNGLSIMVLCCQVFEAAILTLFWLRLTCKRDSMWQLNEGSMKKKTPLLTLVN